jgi:hypothetical protein
VSGLGRVDNGDAGGAAALVVLDIRAGLAATRSVLAGRAVGHLVVELQVAVKLRLDVHAAERELVTLGTTERGRVVLRVSADTTDLLSARAGRKALAAVGTASPPLEAEVVVAREGTEAEVAEIETTGLLLCALVVRVTGAGEGGSISEALGHVSI